MPEEVEQPDNRKISIQFTRTVSDGDYGSSSAQAWVQGEVSPDANESTVAIALGTLFAAAKLAVFDELGVVYHLDEDGVTIREDLAAVTTARVAQALGAREEATGNQNVVGLVNGVNRGIQIKNARDASKDPLPDWAVDAINAAGVKAVFDNRLTAKGDQPKFKEAIRKGEAAVSGEVNDDGTPRAAAWWPPKPKN